MLFRSASGDSAERVSDISAYAQSKDCAAIISALADNGAYLELYAKYAPEMSVGFISIAGTVAGIVANRKCENGGIVTAKAARKASRMITFCDSFNIPVITVLDSQGPDVSAKAEAEAYAAELSRLAFAYANAKTPMITLIAGEA